MANIELRHKKLSIRLKELFPFEKVGPIRREIRVLHKFDEIPFRVLCEERDNTFSNLDGLGVHQLNSAVFQSLRNILYID